MSERDTKGQYVDGHKGVGGAPLSGRSQAMAILDRICAETETAEVFEATLRERLKADPLEFYREFVVALAPKQLDIVDVTKLPTITEDYFKAMNLAVPNKPDE